jgi:hypothetical protein
VPVRVRNSEVYRPGEQLPARDPIAESIAHLMDGAIPIGRWSIGIDPLLGLVPGIGDLIGTFISMIILARAFQAGIPRIAIARMTVNIALDTVVGSIPLLGDVFDFAYKANLKNLRIYQEALQDGRRASTRHWGFFIAAFVVAALALIAIIAGLVALVRRAF